MIAGQDLPAAPGTYLLIMWLAAPATVAVGFAGQTSGEFGTARLHIGRLGQFAFAAGTYAYTGSAHGPGGLRARLARHLRAAKKRHWHIDYLVERASVVAVWAEASAGRLECAWAGALAALPGAERPAPRFGASDCACPAHLFRLPEGSLPAAWEALGRPRQYPIR